jgi:EAL domain-containing protein (putative c-di-GMP-specific phosphodiesterase class I)
MAKTLALPTIVEGVETEEQSEMLRKQGCDMAQGYYYYRPMPVDEYEKSILK